MEHYTLRAREPFTADRGKCIVDPNHMGGFNVRPSHFLPHLFHCSMHPQACRGSCPVYSILTADWTAKSVFAACPMPLLLKTLPGMLMW